MNQTPTDQPGTPPTQATSTAPTEPAAPSAPERSGKSQITIDDFLKLDLRVATVKDCQLHPNADKLLVLQLDDGTPEGRQVCAGLRAFYQPEHLIGRQIVVVANLAPRKMRGEVSQGMLLAANAGDDSQVVVVSPIEPIANGSIVR